MNPAFGVALIPSLYGYAAHTTYHCAEAAYVSILLRIITPLYIPIEGWRPCRGSQVDALVSAVFFLSSDS